MFLFRTHLNQLKSSWRLILSSIASDSRETITPFKLAIYFYELFNIKQRSRSEIIRLCESMISLSNKTEFTDYLQIYQLCDEKISDICVLYLDFNDVQRTKFWNVLGKRFRIDVNFLDSIKNDFDNVLEYCKFDKPIRGKSISYILQNFVRKVSRDLIVETVALAKQRSVDLLFINAQHDEAKPLMKINHKYLHLDRAQQQLYSIDDAMMCQSEKHELSSESFLNFLDNEMSLDEYVSFLENDLVEANPQRIEALYIKIPLENKIFFQQGINFKNQYVSVLSDGSVLTAHEFGHALAYLKGQCIHVEKIPIQSAIGYYFKNPEEFRNIVLGKYSEHQCDATLLAIGIVRLSHRGVDAYDSIETFNYDCFLTCHRSAHEEFIEVHQHSNGRELELFQQLFSLMHKALELNHQHSPKL